MDRAKEFQELDKMDELVDAGGMFDAQHFPGDLVDVQGGNFESRLLVLQEGLYILYFRQVEKGIQPAFGAEEDIKGPDLFTAGGCEIGRIAFKNVWQINPKPINVATAERVHVVLRN